MAVPEARTNGKIKSPYSPDNQIFCSLIQQLAVVLGQQKFNFKPTYPMSENNSDTFEDIPSADDSIAIAKASAKKAAEDIKFAAAAKAKALSDAAKNRATHFREAAEDKAAEFRGYADERWSTASTKAKDFATEAENYAREKPLKALLAAFGIGFVIGAILKR